MVIRRMTVHSSGISTVYAAIRIAKALYHYRIVKNYHDCQDHGAYAFAESDNL